MSDKPSPINVIDLSVLRGQKKTLGLARGLSRHEHPSRLVDVKNELTVDLARRDRQGPHRLPSRWSDSLRMLALGLATVFMLNMVAVYYRGVDLKEELATAASGSYESLAQNGLNAAGLQGIQQQLRKAEESLWFLQNQREALKSQNKLSAEAAALLTAGEALSKAGGYFLKFIDKVKPVSERLFTPKIQGQSVTSDLRAIYDASFVPALEELTLAQRDLQNVNPKIFPASLEPSIRTAQTELAQVVTALTELNQNIPLILELLGDTHPQRFLVLLENSNEIRPGGGFIGSYMILDLNDGYQDGRAFYDVYELDNRYHESIPPPAEIARLTDEWRFRDSNTSPDLRKSAAKAAWFLEEEGGPSVDHVVMVDLAAVAKILDVIGPVKLDELPIALSSDNFATILSYMVEAKLVGQTTPKAILNRFIERVEGKVREQKPWLALGSVVQEMAASKHMALYSKDPDIQAMFDEWGMSGSLPQAQKGEDYFMLVRTSIGGNKTDPYIAQDIRHETAIQADGSMLNTVTVTRTHRWNDSERLRLKNLLAGFGFKNPEPWLIDLLGGGPNTSMMRFYVPHGAELVGHYGLDKQPEKLSDPLSPLPTTDYGLPPALLDYFTFTNTVYPGTSSTFSLTYTLPTSLTFDPLSEYRLIVAKQPSDQNTTFTKTITVAPNLIHYRSFPEELKEVSSSQGLRTYQFTTDLTRDLNLAQLWGRSEPQMFFHANQTAPMVSNGCLHASERCIRHELFLVDGFEGSDDVF